MASNLWRNSPVHRQCCNIESQKCVVFYFKIRRQGKFKNQKNRKNRFGITSKKALFFSFSISNMNINNFIRTHEWWEFFVFIIIVHSILKTKTSYLPITFVSVSVCACMYVVCNGSMHVKVSHFFLFQFILFCILVHSLTVTDTNI